MTLQEQIKKELTFAIKAKDGPKKDTLRVIMGEFSRQPQKELPDEEVVKVLKKLIKSEREVLERSGIETDSEFIRIVSDYLPQMVSEEDIIAWIKQNINFDNSPTNVKLILFRNSLIYFNPSLQNRVLDLMHDKLSATGHLVVGVKEEVTSSGSTSIFEAVNKSEGIFKKKLSAK